MEGRGDDVHIAFGDWQTDLCNCTLILSQAVGFTIFPHSHVHGPARDLNGSTPRVWLRHMCDLHHLCVAETLVAVPCHCLMFMTYIFRHCGLLILKTV